MTTLFDHLKHVHGGPSKTYWNSLSEEDVKTYSTFMINRLVSMSPEYVELANISQVYGLLDPKSSYEYYSNVLPKRSSWVKYIKGKSDEVDHPEWMIDIVAKNFEVSKRTAVEYITLYFATDDGKSELRALCDAYAIDQKLIKKAKL